MIDYLNLIGQYRELLLEQKKILSDVEANIQALRSPYMDVISEQEYKDNLTQASWDLAFIDQKIEGLKNQALSIGVNLDDAIKENRQETAMKNGLM